VEAPVLRAVRRLESRRYSRLESQTGKSALRLKSAPSAGSELTQRLTGVGSTLSLSYFRSFVRRPERGLCVEMAQRKYLYEYCSPA
jgi:hypothetical protein